MGEMREAAANRLIRGWDESAQERAPRCPSYELAWPDPYELAQNDDVMAKLWLDSAHLVGVQEVP